MEKERVTKVGTNGYENVSMMPNGRGAAAQVIGETLRAQQMSCKGRLRSFSFTPATLIL